MSHNLLPSGQLWVEPQDFPVLDLGKQPKFDPETYRLKIDGLVGNPVELSYAQLIEMADTDQNSDFHCVTTWSKKDVHWKGIPFNKMLELVKPLPTAESTMQYGLDGYSTNVALAEFAQPNILLALYLDDKPIPLEHGAPCRIVIPHLYAWKGAKFLNRIEFIQHDRPGFWEVRGYHIRGNALQEERYS